MRIGYHRVPSPVLVVLCLVAAVPGAADSVTAFQDPEQEQQPQPLTIAVKSGRPLADAIKTLERRHGFDSTAGDCAALQRQDADGSSLDADGRGDERLPDYEELLDCYFRR